MAGKESGNYKRPAELARQKTRSKAVESALFLGFFYSLVMQGKT
jgi:hypothetical protein